MKKLKDKKSKKSFSRLRLYKYAILFFLVSYVIFISVAFYFLFNLNKGAKPRKENINKTSELKSFPLFAISFPGNSLFDSILKKIDVKEFKFLLSDHPTPLFDVQMK